LKSPGNLVVKEVPVPQPAVGEVLVKVMACGICGSDLRYYQGENPWALHTLGEARENPPNIILGHKFAGEIVETGDSRASFLKGKRVVVIPFQTCGQCALCRSVVIYPHQ